MENRLIDGYNTNALEKFKWESISLDQKKQVEDALRNVPGQEKDIVGTARSMADIYFCNGGEACPWNEWIHYIQACASARERNSGFLEL